MTNREIIITIILALIFGIALFSVVIYSSYIEKEYKDFCEFHHGIYRAKTCLIEANSYWHEFKVKKINDRFLLVKG